MIAGRYRVVEKIGRGGMGAIYQADHVATGRRFAVKMLLPGLGHIAEIAGRFEREARAASSLSHPSIVSVVDFGTDGDGSLFLAMELVNGRSLAEILEERRLPPARAFGIARQLLEALAHAHAEGVVHRDLKPDNVMLVDAGASDEERDLVKIVDFGIAKWTGEGAGDRLTQAGVAFGTPEYMSPEQALGEEVDARADLYAVGVLLHEMLSGRPPFDGPDKVAVLRKQVAVPPPPIELPEGELAPEVRALVQRALEKHRERRFEGAHEMLAALEVAAEAQAALEQARSAAIASPPIGTVASPAPAPVGPGRPGRRGRRGRMVIAGVVAAVVVLGGLVLATRDAPRARQAGTIEAPPAHVPLAPVEAAGWRAAGVAHAAAGRDGAAVLAWREALRLAPGTIDEATRAALVAMLGRRSGALAAVELLPAAGEPGRVLLVEQASRGRLAAARARARELASAAGVAGEVDLLASFTLDLTGGASCKERREAIPRLRALGDKAAIPALRRARGRTGGFLNLRAVNACLEKDAAEAIEFLQALP